MKIIFKVFLFLLLPIWMYAQSSWQIAGKVLDPSKNPMPFANVFVNNTRIGTTTDQNGKFLLTIPAKFQKIELVISFVGYTTLKKNFSADDSKLKNLVFIFGNGMELKEVAVTAKHDRDWKRKWRIFENALMGESDFRKDCKIINSEVIRLEYDENKHLIATANEPIIIQNNAFGLKIKFQIEKFEIDGEKVFFAGSKFFENIDSSSAELQKKWEKNKKRSYNDSFRNFLVSLSQRKLKENGFEVFKILKPKVMYYGRTTVANEISDGVLARCSAEEICSYDTDSEQFILRSDMPLMVFAINRFMPMKVFNDYPFQYSNIYLVNFYAGFTENGWLSKPNGIFIQGYWGKEGFANLLPDDYFSEDKELKNNLVVENNVVAITSKSFISDTIVKNIVVQGIIYDKGAVAEEEKKEFSIISNDINIKISENDYKLSVFDLLRRIPGLIVLQVQGMYQVHFLGSNTNLGGGGGSLTPALMLDGSFITDEETIMNYFYTLNVRDIKNLGAIKYGNSAAFGSRGGNGTIVINTKK